MDSFSFLSQQALRLTPAPQLHVQHQLKSQQKQQQRLFDLTSGQLPFRPPVELIGALNEQLSFLQSFQYPSVTGDPQLLEKLKNYWWQQRPGLKHTDPQALGITLTPGAKQGLFSLFSLLLNPGDEIIFFSPYWSSFPQMAHCLQAQVTMVQGHQYRGYLPDLKELASKISTQTKMIVLNSPNNPTGVHYPQAWMEEFAQLMLQHPQVFIISDEVYHELVYFDPRPSYFYEIAPSLLERTAIVDSFSKSFASAGLRAGYLLTPPVLTETLHRWNSHTGVGVSSLVQQALRQFPLESMEPHWKELTAQLRRKSQLLKEVLTSSELAACWYQTNGAFYFILDLRRTPYFKQHYGDGKPPEHDLSEELCQQILQHTQVALVPGRFFGLHHSARLSLLLEEELFAQALKQLTRFLIRGASV
jgi:aspartate aminotransferase